MSDLDITVIELTRERDALLVENRELKDLEGYQYQGKGFGNDLNEEQREGLRALLAYHWKQVVELRGKTFNIPPAHAEGKPRNESWEAYDKRVGSYDKPETVVAHTDRIAFHRRAVGVLEGLV